MLIQLGVRTEYFNCLSHGGVLFLRFYPPECSSVTPGRWACAIFVQVYLPFLSTFDLALLLSPTGLCGLFIRLAISFIRAAVLELPEPSSSNDKFVPSFTETALGPFLRAFFVVSIRYQLFFFFFLARQKVTVHPSWPDPNLPDIYADFTALGASLGFPPMSVVHELYLRENRWPRSLPPDRGVFLMSSIFVAFRGPIVEISVVY